LEYIFDVGAERAGWLGLERGLKPETIRDVVVLVSLLRGQDGTEMRYEYDWLPLEPSKALKYAREFTV
jgi:hypothetical protein